VVGRASSWGITSGSSRARFNPLDGRVTAGSTTTVPSVETEDVGGRELVGKVIEFTLSLLKIGTDLRHMHKHHYNEADADGLPGTIQLMFIPVGEIKITISYKLDSNTAKSTFNRSRRK